MLPLACRYISGLLAHSKGKSLGMYEDHDKTEEEKEVRLCLEVFQNFRAMDKSIHIWE